MHVLLETAGVILQLQTSTVHCFFIFLVTESITDSHVASDQVAAVSSDLVST